MAEEFSFDKLKEKAGNVLDFIKQNPETVTTPLGSLLGIGTMSALTNKEDRNPIDYALSGLGGAGVGYTLGNVLKPMAHPEPPPQDPWVDRNPVTSLVKDTGATAWDHKGTIAMAALLALAGRGIYKLNPYRITKVTPNATP